MPAAIGPLRNLWSTAADSLARRPELRPGELRRPRAIFLVPRGRPGFDGNWRLRTPEMIQSLRGAGAQVREFEPDSPAPTWLRRFDADFVIAPNMNYVFENMVGAEAIVTRIGRPATMLWDDPLGALAIHSLWERGGRLGWLNEGSETVDMLVRFRAMMSAPGTQHFAWDSGHLAAVLALGLAPRESIEWLECQTYRPYLELGRMGGIEPRIDVSFCGNLWDTITAESNFAAQPFFSDLTARLATRKLANLGSPIWDLILSELEQLTPADRQERGLLPSRTEFWDFYLYAAWFAVNTAVRTGLMSQLEHDVEVFGLFSDAASEALLGRHSNLRFGGNRHVLTELPGTFASTKVNLCISNTLVYQGLPTKFVACIASGGFALIDTKADLVTTFGEDVRAIMFDNVDELNAKVEYFLARPHERREIVETLRAVVEERCTTEAIMGRVIERRRAAFAQAA